MSLVKGPKSGEAPAAGAGTPQPGGTASPDIGANPGADESARFQAPPASERPDYVPEKFWKDGRLDAEAAFTSYKELETRFTTKTEELLKQLDADRRKGLPESPDKYELSLGEDAPLPKEDLEGHPALDWWRKTAFETGLPPEKFNEGVSQIVDILTSGPDLEAEKKALGENADVRIEAVANWARTNFQDPEEFAAIQLLGTSASGIKVLERLMGKPTGGFDDAAPSQPAMTMEKLKSMQSDPRYWDRARRDPEWVKQVDEGFARLYGQKK